MPEQTRDAVILARGRTGHKDPRYTRHKAVGRRTLCGVQLGGRIPSPPELRDGSVTVHDCRNKACA